MSSNPATYHTSKTSSSKMLFAMVGIGLACALFIVLTYEGTKEIIAINRAEALEKAIFKVLPGTSKTMTYEYGDNGSFSLLEETDTENSLIYAGYTEQNELTGIAIEARGQGYADIIGILYGYDPEKEQIIGFHVLESKETPGLGDKIEKDDKFLQNFIALDASLLKGKIKNPIITVKHGSKINDWEVDGITGATISSRAIGEILSASTANWMPIIYRNIDQLIINNKEINEQ